MAENSRWWRRGEREKACEDCKTKCLCFEYQGDGPSPCGYRVLCESCYENNVPRVHHSGMTRRQWFWKVCTVISAVCIGGIGGYTLKQRKYQEADNIEKELLVDWAMTRAENVSRRIIREYVDAAYETEFPVLVMAIIGAETLPKFDPGSVSKAGCWGPMQVNPPIWEKELIEQGIIIDKQDLFDPTLGVRAGVYIFRHYLAKAHGNLKRATRAYVGADNNTADAEKYFNCIQFYLGEIYLSLDTKINKGERDGDGKE